ncbi:MULTISPECIES: hypothetical protein [Bacillus subtilis group]|uniref:hypothetical protein n=1 Tax=Bacillus subtilis group TaxID=653685 RepID=UPI000680EB91|nr:MULTISPECIES: hypothetical protein [Bacillus subtilis group]KND05475.1 hypothetical protein ACJ43_21560 [Bacillus paralicheniformis]MCY9266440.1 hypothetical protein [Bacillus licheniformis]MEC0794192.1 hypothetical protein [Bacillus licheniformis]MEC1870693.1 hypothetical protein [Bacillus paralicheniformis]OLQ49646.1 hypothetical protein BHT95_21720 [Bacillus paralicheniformis]
MKYFEIQEPYYALIAVEDDKKVAEVYVKTAADDDGTLKESIKEVSREYALGCVVESVSKTDPEMSVSEFVNDFDKRKNGWLILDGSLA